MKRFTSCLLGFILIFCISGCVFVNQLVGKTPTQPFTVAPYLTDGAVFPQRQEMLVKGEAEEGVLLAISLYDSNNRLYKKVETFASENSTFQTTIKTPKGSFEKYHLVINDSVNEMIINDIVFGEVWLLVGENYDYVQQPISKPNNSVRYYSEIAGEYMWHQEATGDVPLLAQDIALELVADLQVPIGVVLSTTPIAHADAWISKENIDLLARISSFIKETNRYIETEDQTYNDNDMMSAMYEKTLRPFEGFSFKGAIVNLGYTDYEQKDPTINGFDRKIQGCLQAVVDQLIGSFGSMDVYFLQIGYSTKDYAASLRETQAVATYLHSRAHVIATYDLYEEVLVAELDEEEDEEDSNYEVVLMFDRLIERVSNIIVNSTYRGISDYLCPSYTNHVVIGRKVAIEFYNCNQLKEVSTIMSLNVYDANGEKVPYSFDFDDNWLYINLEIDLDINLEIDEETTYDLSFIIIKYGIEDDLYFGNLQNNYGLPIICFEITYWGIK